jgi:hypothetical protein
MRKLRGAVSEWIRPQQTPRPAVAWLWRGRQSAAATVSVLLMVSAAEVRPTIQPRMHTNRHELFPQEEAETAEAGRPVRFNPAREAQLPPTDGSEVENSKAARFQTIPEAQEAADSLEPAASVGQTN